MLSSAPRGDWLRAARAAYGGREGKAEAGAAMAAAAAAAALERWVSGELQTLLGLSGRHVPAFLVALARRSRSVEELLERLRETEALRVEEPRVRAFARELWDKVGGACRHREAGLRGNGRGFTVSLRWGRGLAAGEGGVWWERGAWLAERGGAAVDGQVLGGGVG